MNDKDPEQFSFKYYQSQWQEKTRISFCFEVCTSIFSIPCSIFCGSLYKCEHFTGPEEFSESAIRKGSLAITQHTNRKGL